MPHEPAPGRPEAILDPERAATALRVVRLAPHPALADLVDYFWLVRWDLGERVHEQRVVPQPRVHLAAEGDRLLVHGPGGAATFDRRLSGRRHVVGAAFHPAGFRPLLDGPVRALAGRVLPAGDVLGVDDRPAAIASLAPGSPTAEAVAPVEDYLLSLRARPLADTAAVSGWVRAAAGGEVTRADALARHAGVGLRTLQRLFAEHVGVGPKWVVQRERLLEVAARVHAGDEVDWSALAAELGFADQAHLVRTWTALTGTPPAAYRRITAGR